MLGSGGLWVLGSPAFGKQHVGKLWLAGAGQAAFAVGPGLLAGIPTAVSARLDHCPCRCIPCLVTPCLMCRRKSIDVLKEMFRDELSKDDWRLVIKLKKVGGAGSLTLHLGVCVVGGRCWRVICGCWTARCRSAAGVCCVGPLRCRLWQGSHHRLSCTSPCHYRSTRSTERLCSWMQTHERNTPLKGSRGASERPRRFIRSPIFPARLSCPFLLALCSRSPLFALLVTV